MAIIIDSRSPHNGGLPHQKLLKTKIKREQLTWTCSETKFTGLGSNIDEPLYQKMALGCASSQSRWGQPQSLFLVQFFSWGETLQVGINGSVSEPTGAHTKPFNEKKRYKDGDQQTRIPAAIGSVTLNFTIFWNFWEIIPAIPLAHECSYRPLGPWWWKIINGTGNKGYAAISRRNMHFHVRIITKDAMDKKGLDFLCTTVSICFYLTSDQLIIFRRNQSRLIVSRFISVWPFISSSSAAT